MFSARFIKLGLALGMAAAQTGSARGAEPAGPALAAEVRAALGKDARLAGLSVGVSVTDGVVTLFGPVPTDELSWLAEGRVRRLAGVRVVINELYVLDVDGRRSPPRQSLAGMPRPVVTDGTGGLGPLPPARFDHGPSPTLSLFPRKSAPDAPEIGMILPAHMPESRQPQAVPALPSRLSADGELKMSIERSFRGGAFARLSVRVEQGVVHVNGAVRQWPDLWRFAEAIARLPGIERVLIDRVVRTDD